MKATKLKYLATGLVFLLVMGACSDDLDRFPHSSIEQSQSFQTVQDAATWNNGLYAQFRARVYGDYMYATDIQADQLNATLDYGNRNGAIHRWDFLADNYTIRDTWRDLYSAITDINVAIAGFETIETEDADDQADLDQYQAENYLARAYYYHYLVTRFAKDYDPASASSDLGVPLMLEYDINNFPARSTVEQVYQQIISDINTAKAGLSDLSGSQGAQRFNMDVALALEARVRLHMEDFPGAKLAADQLIDSGRYPLITDAETFRSMWAEDFAQEVILQMYVNAPNELANTNSVYLGFNGGTGLYSPDFLPTQEILDLYAEDDIRKDAYFDVKPVRISGLDYDDLQVVDKYPGNPELFTGANTNYQHAPIVFRIAEMYLISAEAGARSTGGLESLNALRTARGLEAISPTGDEFLEAVKEERTRELAFEGFRLDDLKRWDEGFALRPAQDLGPIIQGPDFNLITIQPTNPKFIWGIPSNDITINPNLEQNPGW